MKSSTNFVVFVSGHIDISILNFERHYVPHLRYHMYNNSKFVVGDADGVDFFTQSWLKNNLPSEGRLKDVTVFHMFENPRQFYTGFNRIGGFQTDEERDAAMTRMSDLDILWVASGRVNSGTNKNKLRRKQFEIKKGIE